MTDLVFLDTETLGLDPDAPVWEFASVRRYAEGHTDQVQFFISHDPTGWIEHNKPELQDDYRARYSPREALDEHSAAYMINLATRDAIVVGCNPSFDIERLTRLLRRNQLEPAWHYRPICVSTLAYGWLNGVAARAIDEARACGEEPLYGLVGRRHVLPWSSDEVSAAVGVDAARFARHTAMGDVRWAMAQWDAITGSGASA